VPGGASQRHVRKRATRVDARAVGEEPEVGTGSD
jgi:hypothetical protein